MIVRLVALVVAFMLLQSGSSGAAGEAISVRSAQSFIDSIGINVHLAYRDTGYGDFPVVADLLAKLGVKHLRDTVASGNTEVCREDRELAARGVRFTYLTWPGISAPDLVSWASCVGPAIEAYEGANEYDISHPPTDIGWVATLQNAQKRLYADVKGSPSLSSLPVVGPSFSTTKGYRAVGDLSAYLDRGNMHDYLLGQNPGAGGWGPDKVGAIQFSLRDARVVSATKPVMATETGYGTDGSPNCVDAATQAKYIPRLLLEQFNDGVVRTYDYELIDEGGPPYGAYGLVGHDLRPKPSFVALSSLLRLLGGRGPGAQGPALHVTLAGETSNVHHTLLERDGAFYLALWVEAMGFDPSARKSLPVKAQRVIVHSTTPLRTASLYQYSADDELHETKLSPRADIPVSVTDSVSVVKLSTR